MKKLLVGLIPFLCLIITLSSCNKIKDLEYRGIAKTSLKKASLSNASVQVDLKYFNPNSFGVDVKDADLDVYIDDKLMGTADFYTPAGNATAIHIPQNKEFIVPVEAHFDPMKAMGSALKMLTNSKMNIGIKGTAKVGKGGLFIKVPINVSEQIDLKNLN